MHLISDCIFNPTVEIARDVGSDHNRGNIKKYMSYFVALEPDCRQGVSSVWKVLIIIFIFIFIYLFFEIIGQNPSVSKSNHLHVVIFRAFFVELRYIFHRLF